MLSQGLCTVMPLPKRPYPGLRPFEPDEWKIYFGRETVIDDVIERLSRQDLVIIHGPSGTGKSSLARAGVLPKLERHYRRLKQPWHFCAMRPSGGPLWNLAKELAALKGEGVDDRSIDEICRLFSRRDATLSSVINQIGMPEGLQLCILIDQFEELFRFEISYEEAELFVRLIIGESMAKTDYEGIFEDDELDLARVGPDREASPPLPFHIVITLRSEFLGECAQFDGLAEAVNATQYLIPRMQRSALLRAIRRPAELFGGEVSLELAERLVGEVRGREDELPLVQHGLRLLWGEAKPSAEGKIKLDSSALTGGATLSSLLSKHADDTLQQLVASGTNPKHVETMFRALIEQTPKKRAVRRQQKFKDLVAVTGADPDALKKIIDSFSSEHVSFLTRSSLEIKEDTRIDVSHEALIRCWTRISDNRNGWLKAETEDRIRWALALAAAKNEGILNKAQIIETEYLMSGKTPAWFERYEGGKSMVDELIKRSKSAHSFGITRIGFLIFLVAIIVGLSSWLYRDIFWAAFSFVSLLGLLGLTIYLSWI